MLTKIFPGAAIVLILFAIGCSSNQSPDFGYRPLAGDSDEGYIDSPVRPDGFEVGYSSPTMLNPTKARFYATVRAAEITVANHGRYFEILQARPGENIEIWSDTSPAKNQTIQMTNGNVHTPGVSSLVVRIVNAPSPATLDALAVLRDASQRGLPLSAASVNALHNSAVSSQTK